MDHSYIGQYLPECRALQGKFANQSGAAHEKPIGHGFQSMIRARIDTQVMSNFFLQGEGTLGKQEGKGGDAIQLGEKTEQKFLLRLRAKFFPLHVKQSVEAIGQFRCYRNARRLRQ